MKHYPNQMTLIRVATLGAFALAALLPALPSAAAHHELKPLLAQPDKVALSNDFSRPAKLEKEHWQRRQGTRWSIADGVLRGLPSTLEYQASKPDHKGLEARLSVPSTPPEFIARFSIRFLDGKESSIVPDRRAHV